MAKTLKAELEAFEKEVRANLGLPELPADLDGSSTEEAVKENPVSPQLKMVQETMAIINKAQSKVRKKIKLDQFSEEVRLELGLKNKF